MANTLQYSQRLPESKSVADLLCRLKVLMADPGSTDTVGFAGAGHRAESVAGRC